MANNNVYICLVALMVVGSNAFFFNRRPTVAHKTEDVDQSCIEKAQQGSCEFYECFERRLPCGNEWYVYRQGLYYCNKMQRLRDQFTPAGQSFLDDSNRCLTTSLIDMYQQDMVDCHALKHHAIDAISRCYIENAFCNVFVDNTDEFAEVFEPSDLFSSGAGSVWSEMVALGTRCGSEAVRRFASSAGETISNAVESAWNSVINAFNL